MKPCRLLLPGPLPLRVLLWLAVYLVFPFSVTTALLSFQVEVLGSITSQPARTLAWGQERNLLGDLAERVLVYLEKAETKETDPWLRDDIRIAWITVLWSRDGVPDWSLHCDTSPHTAATWQVLHCHPDQVWPRIVARRELQLGPEYSNLYDSDGNWRSEPIPLTAADLSVRKPVQPERRLLRRNQEGRAA